MIRLVVTVASVVVSGLLLSCDSDTARSSTVVAPDPRDAEEPDAPAELDPPAPSDMHRPTAAAYTHHQADGNRWVDGSGRVSTGAPVDVAVAGVPRWLVATAADSEVVWVAVLADGTAQAFVVTSAGPLTRAVEPGRIEPRTPPMAYVQDGDVRLAVLDGASLLSAPVLVDAETSTFAFVTDGGQVQLVGDTGTESLPVDALADARLLANDGRLLVLTGPTTRYGHGVLGDAVEATGVALLETRSGLRVTARIEMTAPAVIEGLAPIWVDVDGDAEREIVVTVSQEGLGARMELYSETGAQLATGPWIGTGFRWRHQIAVGPLAPDGGHGLVVVRTPHIGGQPEFYRWVEDQLRLEATESQSTYQSHVLYWRNLDMALAGDFDGDGRAELLAPSQSRTSLGAVGWEASGATTRWQVPVGGRVTTNLAAAALGDGRVAVGVGHDGRAVRLWLP